MADNESTSQFPYQHLAVLGMEKMKKYVPPASTDASVPRTPAARVDAPSTSNGSGRK